MDGRRCIIGDEDARRAAFSGARAPSPVIGSRNEAPSRSAMIGSSASAPLVRKRTGVWEVSVGGVFVGDYAKREHADEAAARRIGAAGRKTTP